MPIMWIEQIFQAKTAKKGNVVRRSVADVIRFASIDALKAAVKERRFHLFRTGEQFVIVCNEGEIHLVA